MMRSGLRLAGAGLAAFAAVWSGTVQAQGGAEIAWDNWGVPHIEAESAEAATYALGWSQARGRPDQLLELLAQGGGRAASLWGEDYYEGDALMWTMGVPQSVDGLLDAQDEPSRSQLDAYVAGINAWFAANPESGSQERRRALPVTARDALGHSQRAVNVIFVAMGDIARTRAMVAAQAQEDETGDAGSNAWAIAPSRSASGNALLLINPHLPWDGIFTWFESHIRRPGFEAYGVSLLGQPLLGMAFNEDHGWAHTVNRLDNADVYAVPIEGAGYRFGDEIRTFEETTVEIGIRQPDGSLEIRRQPVRRTVHGPVIAMSEDTAYAIKVAGLQEPDRSRRFAQYERMAAATNREEFEAALAMQQTPMFNIIYADANGEILYVSGGLHPVRPRGDHAFWAGPVDGSDPELLWDGYQPYERLLRVANPPSGFVQNSNETGFTATIPPVLDPENFPGDYIAPDMQSRPQHGIEMVTSDESITLDELVAYAHDTRLTLADNILDELVAAARADGRHEAARAADVLEGWNRRTDADSRGAALFTLWAFEFVPNEPPSLYAEQWSFDDPTGWPDGLADPEGAVDALVATVERMEAGGMPLDIAWGELARIPDGESSLPSSLGLGRFGAFRVANFEPDETGLAFDYNGGTTFVAAIEFGDELRARAILPYGNFERRPDGVDSQLPLFSRGEFRSVNYTPAEIEAATVWRESLSYQGE